MKKRRLYTILLVLLTIVLVLVGTAGAGFAQDLAEFTIVLPIMMNTTFQYVDSDIISYGEIEINVETYSSGGADGSVAARWTDENSVSHAVNVDVTGVEAIRRDMNGDLEELVLNGRGRYFTAGEERAFAATVALNWNAWTADDLRVSLLGPGSVAVLPLQIGPLEGRVEGSYPYDVFCDQYGENCQPAPP